MTINFRCNYFKADFYVSPICNLRASDFDVTVKKKNIFSIFTGPEAYNYALAKRYLVSMRIEAHFLYQKLVLRWTGY